MNPLFAEAAEYIRLEWDEFEKTLKPHHIRKAVVPYAKYLQSLVPETEVSEALRPYVNKQLILYDKYMNDEIQVFLYDPKDDNASFFSDSELDDAAEDEVNFVNGVKVCDEYDFREQITANKFTGGYWDPEIHWVIERKTLKSILDVEKKKD
jgi:hypothetical protein